MPGYRAFPCMYKHLLFYVDIFIYVSQYIHIREYIGLSTITVTELPLLWRRVLYCLRGRGEGVTIGTYIIYLSGCISIPIVYVLLPRIYLQGCKYFTMLHLSMCLYMGYCVYSHMDICGYGALINRCIYELLFKYGKKSNHI
jgi:hypothetical protein